MASIIAVLFRDDDIIFQQSITNEDAERQYRRHRKAGHVPRPITTYGFGYCEDVICTYDKFEVMIKSDTLTNVKIINFATCMQNKTILSWLNTLTTVSVLIENTSTNDDVVRSLLPNNQIEIVTLECSELTIGLLKQVGNTNIKYILKKNMMINGMKILITIINFFYIYPNKIYRVLLFY